MPIFGGFGVVLTKPQAWEKRLKCFLKVLTFLFSPPLASSVKNYFAQKPTNFRYARVFVKYIFLEPYGQALEGVAQIPRMSHTSEVCANLARCL